MNCKTIVCRHLCDVQMLLPSYDRAFIITDSNVSAILPELLAKTPLKTLPVLEVSSGEGNKTLSTASVIWEKMQELGATRYSLCINVGGGMVTDLGGFAASLYKRGIKFINVSTTLLGAVDASIGGKTGVDFSGLKNQIGVFSEPECTYIPLSALKTLPETEFLSGMGEVLKSAYIGAPDLLSSLLERFPSVSDDLTAVVERCLAIKRDIVLKDPCEQHLRKVLNLGHTAGHAFESFLMKKGMPVPHGVAVAHGLLVALILSHRLLSLDSKHIYQYSAVLKEYFPKLSIKCDDFALLLQLMRSDKKNVGCDITFVLLRDIGDVEPNVKVSESEIEIALDIYRDLVE